MPTLRFAIIQIRELIRDLLQTVQPAVSKRFHENFRNPSRL